MPLAAVESRDAGAILRAFHDEHNRLFGYSLEQEATPVEIVNVRVQSIGMTEKLELLGEPFAGADASAARKGERPAYVFEKKRSQRFRYSTATACTTATASPGRRSSKWSPPRRSSAPATMPVTDQYGSLLMYRKGRDDLVRACLGAKS